MSWLSDYLDKHGMHAVNTIGGPLVNAAGAIAHTIPVVGTAMDVGNTVGNMIPGTIYDGPGGSTGGTNTPPTGGTAGNSSSAVDYLTKLMQGSTGGDILRTAGSAIGGYMNNAQAQAALAQRKAEFDQTAAQRKAEFDQTAAQRKAEYERTTGNSEATSAANAEQALNRAPLADKSQYQLMARLGVAPTAFKPRDYTQGLSSIASKPTGGYGDVMDTMAGAAKSYTPGAGNVDTSALALLKNRMLTSAKSPAMPATTPSQPPQTPTTTVPPVMPPAGGMGGSGGAGTTTDIATGAPAGTPYDAGNMSRTEMLRRRQLQLDNEENPY